MTRLIYPGPMYKHLASLYSSMSVIICNSQNFRHRSSYRIAGDACVNHACKNRLTSLKCECDSCHISFQVSKAAPVHNMLSEQTRGLVDYHVRHVPIMLIPAV